MSAKRATGACETISEFLWGRDRCVLECRSGTASILALENQWRRLEVQCSEPFSAFQSANWCFAWLAKRHLDTGSPQIFVLWRNGRAVLIWPAKIVVSRVGARLLTSLADPFDQYCNVIVDRTAVPQSMAVDVLEQAVKHSGVDAVTLRGFPDGSILQPFAERRGYSDITAKEASVLDISQHRDWQEYVATLPKKTRRNRKQRQNRLNRLGRAQYHVHCGGTPEYRELVDRALEMKCRWLRETGRRATKLSSPLNREFMRSLTGECDGSGKPARGVIAHGLYIDDRPVAIEIGILQDRHYYVYLGAFDWDLRAYSPGKIQMELSQKWAFDTGVATYDFLGGASDYKASWTDTSFRLHNCSVPLTKFGHVYCAVWKAVVRPLLKDGFNRLNPRHKKAVIALAGRLAGESAETRSASKQPPISNRAA